MARTMAQSLAKIKSDLSGLLSDRRVERACERIGHGWRDRKLGPATTVRLFVRQLLEGNTSLTHATHWGEAPFVASSYCEARSRLPLELFVDLAQETRAELVRSSSGELGEGWRGHRVFFVDGSSFSMPDTPELQAAFGQPGGQKKGCGFPTARLLALFCSHTGMLLEAFPLPLRTHEQSSVADLHGHLGLGDILLGDRGFCSYAHVALLASRGVHAVFRLHQRIKPGRTSMQSRVKVLNEGDDLVQWRRPKQRPSWMSQRDFAALPERLSLRVVRYQTLVPGCRTREVALVTTLVDSKRYPAKALADLYATRWRCEQNLRDLKQTLGMDVLKCKTIDGVQKEFNVFCLIYNLVRAVMVEAARRRGVPVVRMSFIDALRWLRERNLTKAFERLLVNPDRPGRFEPRVRKRRPKQFPLMQRPRAELKQRLLDNRHAA